MAGGQRAELLKPRGELLGNAADEGAQPERGHDQQLHFYVATVYGIPQNETGRHPV